MKKLKKSEKEYNIFIKGLMENGTIFVPARNYKISKIETFETYYKIWYIYDVKLNSFTDEMVKEASWVKVPFKNINQHLRTEKLKKLKDNVIKRKYI